MSHTYSHGYSQSGYIFTSSIKNINGNKEEAREMAENTKTLYTNRIMKKGQTLQETYKEEIVINIPGEMKDCDLQERDSTGIAEKESRIGTDLMIFDGDPGYHFNSKVFMWYLLGFQIQNHGLNLIRRFFFLFLVNIMYFSSSLQMHWYHNSLFLSRWEFNYVWMHHISYMDPFTKERYDWMLIISYLIAPTTASVIQFLLLSPLLLQRKSIAEILYWNENETALAKWINLKPKTTYSDKRTIPYEIKVYENLKKRLSYLKSFSFWEYLLKKGLFSVEYRPKHVFKIVCKCCVVPMLALLYTIPIFSVFTSIFSKQPQRTRRCYIWSIKHIVLLLGFISLILVLFPVFSIYLYASLLTFIDILRTLDKTLIQLIFLVSACINFRGTFTDLEDEYRNIKFIIFNIIEDMQNSSLEDEQQVVQKILAKTNNDKAAIPKVLFTKVCDVYMPYFECVLKSVIILILKITFLGLAYLIISDYQVFEQFSNTGEPIITAVFVSLPSLLHKPKTEAEMQMDFKRMTLEIKGTIIEMFSLDEI